MNLRWDSTARRYVAVLTQLEKVFQAPLNLSIGAGDTEIAVSNETPPAWAQEVYFLVDGIGDLTFDYFPERQFGGPGGETATGNISESKTGTQHVFGPFPVLGKFQVTITNDSGSGGSYTVIGYYQ